MDPWRWRRPRSRRLITRTFRHCPAGAVWTGDFPAVLQICQGAPEECGHLLTIDIPSTGNVSVGRYDRFALEIKPPDGPVLAVERTVPGRVSQYVNLH